MKTIEDAYELVKLDKEMKRLKSVIESLDSVNNFKLTMVLTNGETRPYCFNEDIITGIMKLKHQEGIKGIVEDSVNERLDDIDKEISSILNK